MESCRICFGDRGTLLPVGCGCVQNSFIHLDCADKWFSDRMTITLTGKLKDPYLTVHYTAPCEICTEPISLNLCREIYKRYDKNLRDKNVT
jgi:hypothetical protein